MHVYTEKHDAMVRMLDCDLGSPGWNPHSAMEACWVTFDPKLPQGFS